MALRVKEYVLQMDPVAWRRPGLCKRAFYDQQLQEKLICGIDLSRQHGDDPQFTKPLHMEVVYYLRQPGTKRKKNQQERWCPHFPDIDNLQKFLMSTFTNSGIWKDEKIVCSTMQRKYYSDHPRTHIILTELE